MEENLRIINTSRGGKKALYKGYMYLKYRTGRKSLFWRCVKRSKCSCIMTTSGENERAQVVVQKEHSHPPDWNSCKAAEFKHKAIEKALTSEDSPDLIVQNLIEATSAEIVANLPKLESIKRAIRRIRNKEMSHKKSCAQMTGIFTSDTSTYAKLAFAYEFTIRRLLETKVSNTQHDTGNGTNGSGAECEDSSKGMTPLAEHYGNYAERK